MELNEGWEVACAPTGAHSDPDGIETLAWQHARVPGTAAGTIGLDGRDFDAEDWWFRCRFELACDWCQAPVTLALDGVATVCEVFLNGDLVASGESMWASLEADATGRLRATNELVVVCRALIPRLGRRRRPAARWRTRVVKAGNLRWFRTMIFGRSPGFAPGPAAVGPFRPVRLTRRDEPAVEGLEVRPHCRQGAWTVSVRTRATKDGATLTARLAGGLPVTLTPAQGGGLAADLPADGLARWWPHTHGEPRLHELALHCGGQPLATRRIGLRELAWPKDPEREGLSLTVNGVALFVRGAIWTPADLVAMAPDAATLRRLLLRARDAGMNMLRIAGTGAYEPAAFHDLCDELGILVWQDLMFANLDYPTEDPEFRAVIEAEARAVLAALAGRPSLAVVCGNSEVEQQPAMMGLDPRLGRAPFWEQAVPALLAQLGTDCAYLSSTPSGGALPFHPDGAATHYFGVSGYFMPLSDLRRAPVGFASECLAFANVPDVVEVPVHHPRWKEGVPRDAGSGWGLGAGWDFDDVRDHYLEALYGVDAVQLRRSDHERYLTLSRMASGEVMAAAIGEWRRRRSPCCGALVLWFKDMLPGAGLGVLDAAGEPKVAYHYLRRAMAPAAVWMTGEGLSGVAVHVANDRGVRRPVALRIAVYRDGSLVGDARERIELTPHEILERNVEAMLGRYLDVDWAYRFGPPAADVIVAELQAGDDASTQPAGSTAFYFPVGYPMALETGARLGLRAGVCATGPDTATLTVASERVVYGVRVDVTGFAPDDDCFSVEPGRPRRVGLRATSPSRPAAGGFLTAANLAMRCEITREGA